MGSVDQSLLAVAYAGHHRSVDVREVAVVNIVHCQIISIIIRIRFKRMKAMLRLANKVECAGQNTSVLVMTEHASLSGSVCVCVCCVCVCVCVCVCFADITDACGQTDGLEFQCT